ncbi:mitofilin family membrane protein [Neorhizobium sp. JUb45]|uniref:COG4223 family protein n=1 Tax=Neorhizobium sp. JUb45 TaxID=2485113 RepID=UPI0010CE5B19|nr:mitofilin family membrane protein [Neorhizobium sp. JUb45]TCR01213.1 hypothetical protein EDF70_105220 [Neorhizobium sp. JUb45]
MVSDKPPRRSKSDKSPVTIDLAADDVSTIATPVRSDDSDAPVNAAKKDAESVVSEKPPVAQSASTATGPQDTKPADVKPAVSVSAPRGNAESGKTPEVTKHSAASASDKTGPATSAPTSSPSSASASAASSTGTSGVDTPNKPFGTSTAGTSAPIAGATSASAKAGPGSTSTSAPAKEQPRQSPATSSLIAAGIVGGVVALALVGSMFYAGVIPGSSGGSSTETATLQQQIDSLNQQLASSTAAIEALKATAAAGNGATGGSTEISDRLAALEARITEAGSNTAASDALTQRLAALEAKVDQPGREEAVAKALAASALKTAIDRGGPFTGELQTFSGIAGDDPAVQVLGKFAQSGVPSASDLVQKFPQTANAILNAANQTDEQAGVGSRLLSSAMQMVKVRPVGDVEGDTPEAIVARMEDQLRKGNLKGATSEWEALPQSAKDASVAYKQTLDARIEVDGLVDNTLNRAIAGASNAG